MEDLWIPPTELPDPGRTLWRANVAMQLFKAAGRPPCCLSCSGSRRHAAADVSDDRGASVRAPGTPEGHNKGVFDTGHFPWPELSDCRFMCLICFYCSPARLPRCKNHSLSPVSLETLSSFVSSEPGPSCACASHRRG
jgi:hypothetical protein